VPLTLLYHAVLGERSTLVVDPVELDWQLGELVRRGFRALRLDEFHAAASTGEEDDSSVLITFDDAYAHVFEVVTPLLEKHDLVAAVFVPWGYLGAANDWDGEELPVHGLAIARPEAIRGAVDSGRWQIGSHGSRHIDLRTLAPTELEAELEEARLGLSALAGSPVLDLAYPYGAANDAVREAARGTGHRMAFGVDRGHSGGLYALSRLAIRGQEGRRAFTVKTDPELGRPFK
jgi:peptidoglycan/xylan/chitin deacetylase (PgdA/CDA1 family)